MHMARMAGLGQLPVGPECLHSAFDQTLEERINPLYVPLLLQGMAKDNTLYMSALTVVHRMYPSDQLVVSSRIDPLVEELGFNYGALFFG